MQALRRRLPPPIAGAVAIPTRLHLGMGCFVKPWSQALELLARFLRDIALLCELSWCHLHPHDRKVKDEKRHVHKLDQK
jgi:hypothetical protein